MEVETGGRHGRPQQVTGLSLREEPELGTALGALAGRHVRELRGGLRKRSDPGPGMPPPGQPSSPP
ncbi:hypothetical protein ACWEPC_28375 [Nonomuraea sp. NPDC004297]